ncbi:MAG: DUF4136 domain-containing protein [Polyangiaceae bacterium]
MKIFFLVLVAALMSGGCAPAIHVHAIQSPDAHFERYRTIAFDVSRRAPAGHVASPRSADVREHVRQLAAAILQSRGYGLAAHEHADLVVRIEAGRREVEVPTGTGIMPLGGGVSGLPEASRANDTPGNVPGPADMGTSEYHGELDQEEGDLVEGAFVIDAFDGETHQLVWHGSARTEVNPGPVDYGRLGRAVESVLASFPVRRNP